jgi:hypothetical protein
MKKTIELTEEDIKRAINCYLYEISDTPCNEDYDIVITHEKRQHSLMENLTDLGEYYVYRATAIEK